MKISNNIAERMLNIHI